MLVASPSNPESFLYGESYWYEHMASLGFPDIVSRARTDLVERCQHWLSSLLRYRLPPGRVLELGCAPGGFLKLLEASGFTPLGIEMSPMVVDLARGLFGVEVVEGPIERVQLGSGLFDVVCAFDVVEHLPDPQGTLRRIADVLRPDGLLLIQTPVSSDACDSAWMAYKVPGHLFLFSEASLRLFLRGCGFDWIEQLPAIFGGDQFIVASRRPLARRSPEEVASALQRSPDGRLVLALQDLYARERARASAPPPYIPLPSLVRQVMSRLGSAIRRRAAFRRPKGVML